eukprot:m.26680 g.26680  ORF g.26680 m.26680 type:complete len:496 (+) comp4337_c0_seq1:141-1628(+)
MSTVSKMRELLDAEYLAEEAALREKLQAEKQARAEAEKLLAARKAEEEATREQREAEAAAAERARWKVDEEESAKEVARMKAEFKARMEPKKKAEPVKIEEIPTIVLDLGSDTIKAGYAGEDAPRVVTSSVVGRVRGEHFMDLEKHAHITKDVYCGDEVWAHKDVLSIKRVIRNGIVQDWKDFPFLLEHVLFEELKVDGDNLRHYPVLITEPPLNPRGQREKLMKMLFDTYEFAAMYVANTSSLAMYATGQVTGIVIESGYDVSSSCCVFEGSVIPDSLARIEIAGRELDTYLIRLLNERGYRFNEQSIIDSFIARDIKETLGEVCSDSGPALEEAKREAPPEDYDTAANGNNLLPGYDKKRFPDHLTIGEERFQCPEALFNPNVYVGKDLMLPGLHKMVEKSVSALGIDLVKAMYANVVLAGGTSMLTGMAERVRGELSAMVPGTVEVTVHEPPQRHLAAWVGGSILASAKHFGFHWVSREEYLEYGLELAHTV